VRELFGLDDTAAPVADAPADVVELDERRAREQ
jgi:hypothetical protein